MPFVSEKSEAEASLRYGATQRSDPMCTSALVRLRQIARNLHVDTRYGKSAGLARCSPDRLFAG